MKLFAQKCVRCGSRTTESCDGRPTCEPCRRELELRLAAARERQLACPIDGTEMTKAIAHMMVIDRCPTCRGVWLDGGELEHLKEDVARHAMIDVARGFVSAS